MGTFIPPSGYTRIELVHAFSGVAAVHTRMGLVSARRAGLVLNQHHSPTLAVNAHALVAVSLASMKRKESAWK
jgi:hypothetical protein